MDVVSISQAVAQALRKVDSARAVFNVMRFGAKGDGKVVTDAATTAGSPVVTSATAAFKPTDQGKCVNVNGLVSTIKSVESATSVTLNANHTITGTGLSLIWGSDDTSAIQTAINNATSAKGGIVFFPAGTYCLGGPLQDTSGTNGILLLPKIGDVNVSPVTIELRGPYAAPTAYPEGNYTPVPVNSAVLVQCTAASGASPCVIGGAIASQAWSNITLVVQNLTVRCANNPAFMGFQLSRTANVVLENVVVDVNAAITGNVALPTTSSAVGILAPVSGNYGLVRIKAYVVGFYRGVQISEHANLDIFVQCCVQAVNLQPAHHLNVFTRVLAQWCKTVLVGGGAATYAVYVQGNLDIEDGTGTWAPTQHVSDSNNTIVGELTASRVIASVGNTYGALSVTGGINLALNILGQKNPITLQGTTAGSAISKMASSSGSKKFLVYLNGYQNSGTTAQTISVPYPFTYPPAILAQPSGLGAVCSTSTLTLPTSMSSAITGLIVVEGF